MCSFKFLTTTALPHFCTATSNTSDKALCAVAFSSASFKPRGNITATISDPVPSSRSVASVGNVKEASPSANHTGSCYVSVVMRERSREREVERERKRKRERIRESEKEREKEIFTVLQHKSFSVLRGRDQDGIHMR